MLSIHSCPCIGRQRLQPPFVPVTSFRLASKHLHARQVAGVPGTHPPMQLGNSVQRQLLPSQPRGNRARHVVNIWPFDQAWGTQIDGQSLASQLFAASLFPYLAFLFFLHRSGKAPKLTLIGFYFLLAFVAATIPAGIYAKKHYGTSLANVDWLHGTAESLLTVTNLLVVLGLRQGIKEAEANKAAAATAGDDAPGRVESPAASSSSSSAATAAGSVSAGKADISS